MPRSGTWGRGIAEARHRERQQARLERQQREREEGLRSTRGERAGSRPQERRWWESEPWEQDTAEILHHAALEEQRTRNRQQNTEVWQGRVLRQTDDETEAFLRALPFVPEPPILYTYSEDRRDEMRWRSGNLAIVIYDEYSLRYARDYESERKFIDPECFKHMDKVLLGKLIEAVSGQREEELLGIEGWDEFHLHGSASIFDAVTGPGLVLSSGTLTWRSMMMSIYSTDVRSVLEETTPQGLSSATTPVPHSRIAGSRDLI